MVKVLVATTEGQGLRPDDYAWAVDGELVYVPLPATGSIRGFVGMASNRLTTTAMVVERPDLGLADVMTALGDSLERQGLLERSEHGSDEVDELFRRLLERLLATAGHFGVGAIIERSGERLHRRAQTEPLAVPSDVAGQEH
ncbi:MAG: hypothetical protein AAF467_06905 [Actinomycetota bacterium]